MPEKSLPPFPVPAGRHSDSCAILERVLDWLLCDWWQRADQLLIAEPCAGNEGDIRHVHIRPELFIQLGGRSDFTFPQHSMTLRHGDLLLLPRLLPHEECNHDSPEPFCNLVVMPNPGFLGLHISASDGSGGQAIIPESRVEIRSPLIEAVNSCIDACIRRRFGPLHEDQAGQTWVLLRAVCVLLADIVKEYRRNCDPAQDRIARCRNLIELKLMDPELSVAELGAWLDCHPDHLSRLFRKDCGLSVQAYLIQQRVALARHLLRGSDLPIAEVAAACGFSDPAYFSRCFKRAVGRAPKQFRQELDHDEGNASVSG